MLNSNKIKAQKMFSRFQIILKDNLFKHHSDDGYFCSEEKN